ncbi:MAG TPA: hypothetical protein VF189_04865 [Patescibacteria group bacterium]
MAIINFDNKRPGQPRITRAEIEGPFSTISLEDRKNEKKLREDYEAIEKQKQIVRQNGHKVLDGVEVPRRRGKSFGSTRTYPTRLSHIASELDILDKQQSEVAQKMWTKTTTKDDGTIEEKFDIEGYHRAEKWLIEKGYWKGKA